MSEKRYRNAALLAWLRMIRLMQRISRDGSEVVQRFGVSAPQFILLMRVQTQPGVTQQQLAEELGVTKGNVSQLVAKLVGDGLLQRETAGSSNHLVLTQAGEQLVQQIVPEHDAFIQQAFAGLTQAEQEQLHSLLAKLERGLR